MNLHDISPPIPYATTPLWTLATYEAIDTLEGYLHDMWVETFNGTDFVLGIWTDEGNPGDGDNATYIIQVPEYQYDLDHNRDYIKRLSGDLKTHPTQWYIAGDHTLHTRGTI